ncbi:unnamed protein product, partial [Prorocentrum cordatum]
MKAGELTIFGPRPAHAPWAVQFGSAAREVSTAVAMDTAEPDSGLGHALVAGYTNGTIENALSARLKGEAAGLEYDWDGSGLADSNYIEVSCGYFTPATTKTKQMTTCRYLRLELQPLDLLNLGGLDGWVSKVAYNGSQLWTRQIGTDGDDLVTSVGADPLDHSIIVGGYTTGSMIEGAPIDPFTGLPSDMSGGKDCFLAKLSQYGEYVTAVQFGSLLDDWVAAIAVGDDGSIYVALTRGNPMLGLGTEGGSDGTVVKFSSDLDFEWLGSVVSEFDDELQAIALHTGADGVQRAIVAGWTRD